jgi:ABC-2 type transport system permease protein
MEVVMKNLLKSNFYKLFRSKAFYICTFVDSLLMLIPILILKLTDKLAQNELDSSGEITAYTRFPFMGRNGMTLGLKNVVSSDVLLFLAILVAIFITSEFSHGTMKNIVSKGFEKFKIYISFLITMASAALIMVLFSFLVSTIVGTIVTGSLGINGEIILRGLRLLAIVMLLYIAMISIFVMIAMTIRSNGGVIAINICTYTFGILIYEVLNLVVRNILDIKTKIDFMDYSIMNNISIVGENILHNGNNDFVVRSILVGLVFLIATTALGIMGFKKIDVK